MPIASQTHQRMKAIITLVINDKYVPAAQVLGSSLKRLKPWSEDVDIICMIIPGVNYKPLLPHFDRILRVAEIAFDTNLESFSKKVIDHYRPWAHRIYTKMQFVHVKDRQGRAYERSILLDADMLPLAWPDKLFTIPTPALWFDLTDNTRHKASHAVQDPYPNNRVAGTKMPKEIIEKALRLSKSDKGRIFIGGLPVCVVSAGEADLQEYLKFMVEKPKPYGNPMIINAPDEQSVNDYFLHKGLDLYHCGNEHCALLWRDLCAPEGNPSPVILHMIGPLKPCFLVVPGALTEEQKAEVMTYPDTEQWLKAHALLAA